MAKSEDAVGSMCISITKTDDREQAAFYDFSASVWRPTPNAKERQKKVGTAVGALKIDKQTGDVTLLTPMPGDVDGRRFAASRHVLTKHFRNGDFPDTTMFASG